MLQYMKHRKHGTHIAYNQAEIEANEKNGWVCVDHPHDNPFEEKEEKIEEKLEDLSVDELKEKAKEKGLKVHHMIKDKKKILKIIKG